MNRIFLFLIICLIVSCTTIRVEDKLSCGGAIVESRMKPEEVIKKFKLSELTIKEYNLKKTGYFRWDNKEIGGIRCPHDDRSFSFYAAKVGGGLQMIFNPDSETFDKFDFDGNMTCKNGMSLLNFSYDKITEIYIPKQPHVLADGKIESHAYFRHGDERITIWNDIFSECFDIHIKGEHAYRQLPDGCQFMIELWPCNERYVCARQGCKRVDFDNIIDIETGAPYPVDFD